MADPRLIPLSAWAEREYGEARPHSNTLYSWVRDGKIFPPPEKHGRTYFVRADAVYSPCGRPTPSLVERINAARKAS